MKFKFILASAMLALSTSQARAELNVFACEPEWAALANALIPEGVATVFSATSWQQDPHHIQARPGLIAKARKADLLICTGAELEAAWLSLLLRKSANPAIQPGKPGHFIATDYVEKLGVHDSVDRSMGDVHASGNPHVQVDPFRMAQISEALTRVLIAQLPDHQSAIEAANTLLSKALRDLGTQAREKIAQHSANSVTLVAQHDNWVYLSDWSGLPVDIFIEPKPGIAPSSAHLAKLVKTLQGKPQVLILSAVYLDDKPVKWLSGKIAANVIRFPMSPKAWNKPDSLLNWYDSWIAQIISGLQS